MIGILKHSLHINLKWGGGSKKYEEGVFLLVNFPFKPVNNHGHKASYSVVYPRFLLSSSIPRHLDP